MGYLRALPPHGEERNTVVLHSIDRGELDPGGWVLVSLGRIDLEVSADYLKIDGSRIPMNARVAQAAVDKFDAVLPTPAIVGAIEDAARRQGGLVPFDPWPRYEDDSQLATSTILWREANIARRLAEARPSLVAGCLKDVVLSGMMPSGRVVIFGAKSAAGARVQPVYAGHGDYFDGGYAHGVRAVRRRCWLDGEETTVDAILSGPHAALLGGPVAALRYPTPAETAPTDRPAAPEGRPTEPPPSPGPRVLRRGDRGEDVRELQELLSAAGFTTKADGIFGVLTEAAVRTYQGEHGLTQDGRAGAKTLASLRAQEPGSFDPLRMAPPLGAEERLRLFGSFEWEAAPVPGNPENIRILGGWARDNIVTIEVPSLRGKGYAGPQGRVTCHRRAAPTLLCFFAEVERAGLADRILTFDGCWVPRLVRGGSTLSNHSFGIDVDLNAAWNPRGTMGAARGERGSVVELLPIAHACGMGWGGVWRLPYAQPDPMHFSVREPRA